MIVYSVSLTHLLQPIAISSALLLPVPFQSQRSRNSAEQIPSFSETHRNVFLDISETPEEEQDSKGERALFSSMYGISVSS